MNERFDRESGFDLWQILQLGMILAAVYIIAAGPVFRMSARRQIPFGCIAIYRPVMTPSSPVFGLFRPYVAWWI